MRITYNQAWGGLDLHSDTGIQGSQYDTVKFAIHGGSTGGQRPYVILYRPDQSLLGTVYLPDGYRHVIASMLGTAV